MSAHDMPFGAALIAGGGARFSLWAPARELVTLELLGDDRSPASTVPMRRGHGGWHELTMADAGPGARYRFRLDASLVVPDPASRRNPLDVHGPSEVVDPDTYRWRHTDWRGRPWHEAIVYELHVGTFTDEGTFDAARRRLPELAALGITAVELMPVADFPGARNWGYDGVLMFAPDSRYGEPDALRALVDDAHGLGMSALLDVVYNHFGPDGNYLHAYAPQFFDASRHTPWGAAIAFDGPDRDTVRGFYVHNALYWIEEFGFDGLRLDAVHAIEERCSPDIVEAIGKALRDGPGRDRHVHLVLENIDLNQARYLRRPTLDAAQAPDQSGAAPGPICASAQWNDDVHHCLHVLLTGESDGYYADYADAAIERLGIGLAQGFVYQGQASRFRDGEPRGEPSIGLPPAAMVNFLQTHDQVGNRAFGERIDTIADPTLMPAALACVLLAPAVPMLFMGEEFAASTPFLYFCDFNDDLAEAVRNGRRAEFARFAAFRDPAVRAGIPDPNAIETFERSKLQWAERLSGAHSERLALVREMLQVRHRLFDRLARIDRAGTYRVDQNMLRVQWTVAARSPLRLGEERLVLRVNFGVDPVSIPRAGGEVLFSHRIAIAPKTVASTAHDSTLCADRGAALLTLEQFDG